MSTPSRPARSETRFCRVPQWLYGSGVSLQAIATYGWLHGRYGHFERITPSYATLAKELGVSRGSVISYVKELQAAGAVRVITSGAAGRQTNEFAIAFDAPFATESTGQHSDQSAGRPVSGLYRTGQRADPGGQRAVQEKDVSLKTYEDSLSSDAPEPDAPAPPAPPDERETNPLLQRLMADHGCTEQEAAAVLDQVRHEGRIGSLTGWARSETGRIDIRQRLYELRAAPRASPQPAPDLPDWCKRCGDHNPAAALNPRFRTTPTGEKCPTCHPEAIKDNAA